MSDLNKYIQLMRHLSKQLLPNNYIIQKVDFISENSSDNFQEQAYLQNAFLGASFQLMNNGNFLIHIEDSDAPTDLLPLRGFYSIENKRIFFTAQSEYVYKIGFLLFLEGTILKDDQSNYVAQLRCTSRMTQLAYEPKNRKNVRQNNMYEMMLILKAL